MVGHFCFREDDAASLANDSSFDDEFFVAHGSDDVVLEGSGGHIAIAGQDHRHVEHDGDDATLDDAGGNREFGSGREADLAVTVSSPSNIGFHQVRDG